MELEWMMLANYAEADGSTGAMNITGGGIDTVMATAPLEGAPPEVVAVVNMYLALRLVFHLTELDRQRQFEITIMDEDGQAVGAIQGIFEPQRQPNTPPGWPQGFHLVFPLAGLPLPRFGLYTINMQVDGNHLGDRPFRLLKGY
jgi:hypothetical protein